MAYTSDECGESREMHAAMRMMKAIDSPIDWERFFLEIQSMLKCYVDESKLKFKLMNINRNFCASEDFVCLKSPLQLGLLKLQIILTIWESKGEKMHIEKLSGLFNEICTEEELSLCGRSWEVLYQNMKFYPQLFHFQRNHQGRINVSKTPGALSFENFFKFHKEPLKSGPHKVQYFIKFIEGSEQFSPLLMAFAKQSLLKRERKLFIFLEEFVSDMTKIHRESDKPELQSEIFGWEEDTEGVNNGILSEGGRSAEVDATRIRSILKKECNNRPVAIDYFYSKFPTKLADCRENVETVLQKSADFIYNEDMICLNNPCSTGLVKMQLVLCNYKRCFPNAKNMHIQLLSSRCKFVYFPKEKDAIGKNHLLLTSLLKRYPNVFSISSETHLSEVTPGPELIKFTSFFKSEQLDSTFSCDFKMSYFVHVCGGTCPLRLLTSFASICLLPNERKLVSSDDEVKKRIKSSLFMILSNNEDEVVLNFENWRLGSRRLMKHVPAETSQDETLVLREHERDTPKGIIVTAGHPLTLKAFYTIFKSHNLGKDIWSGILGSAEFLLTDDFICLNTCHHKALVKIQLAIITFERICPGPAMMISSLLSVLSNILSESEQKAVGRVPILLIKTLQMYPSLFILPSTATYLSSISMGKDAITFDSYFGHERSPSLSAAHKIAYFIHLCGGSCGLPMISNFIERSLQFGTERKYFEKFLNRSKTIQFLKLSAVENNSTILLQRWRELVPWTKFQDVMVELDTGYPTGTSLSKDMNSDEAGAVEATSQEDGSTRANAIVKQSIEGTLIPSHSSTTNPQTINLVESTRDPASYRSAEVTVSSSTPLSVVCTSNSSFVPVPTSSQPRKSPIVDINATTDRSNSSITTASLTSSHVSNSSLKSGKLSLSTKNHSPKITSSEPYFEVSRDMPANIHLSNTQETKGSRDVDCAKCNLMIIDTLEKISLVISEITAKHPIVAITCTDEIMVGTYWDGNGFVLRLNDLTKSSLDPEHYQQQATAKWLTSSNIQEQRQPCYSTYEKLNKLMHELFENDEIQKVVYNACTLAEIILKRFGTRLSKIFDVKIACTMIEDRKLQSLPDVQSLCDALDLSSEVDFKIEYSQLNGVNSSGRIDPNLDSAIRELGLQSRLLLPRVYEKIYYLMGEDKFDSLNDKCMTILRDLYDSGLRLRDDINGDIESSDASADEEDNASYSSESASTDSNEATNPSEESKLRNPLLITECVKDINGKKRKVWNSPPPTISSCLCLDRKGRAIFVSPCDTSCFNLNLSNLTEECLEQFNTRNDEDTRKLMEVLGNDISQGLHRLATDQGFTVNDITEIVLDLGRVPDVKFPTKICCLDQGDKVTAKMLECIVSHEYFTGFSERNQAGIEDTLHSLRGIKNRKGIVNGITVRVGSTLPGCADIIYDLAQAGKSMLIMAREDSNKTILLRELARCISDVINHKTVIIDSQNEIGGNGDLPHEAIGKARRIEVPSVENQFKIITECVNNHTPQTVIIHQIETAADASAALSVVQRDIQVIAGVPGVSLNSLIRNPTFACLVEDFWADRVSSMSGLASVSSLTSAQSQVQFSTFDVLIEMQEADRWIIHDFANSVRMSLADGIPNVQARMRFGLRQRMEGFMQQIMVNFVPYTIIK